MAAPFDPLALFGGDVPPQALMAARAAALRRQPAQRPATAEEAEAPGSLGPTAALSPTMALAEALRTRPVNPGAYDLFGGASEDDVRKRAEGMNYDLRGQRAAGKLGLLTGDRVLSGFGQSQLQGADKREAMLADAGQFRAGQALKSALAAEEAKRAKAKQEHDDAEREKDRAAQKTAAAIQAGDKATQAKLENETGLRKEFNSLPEVKDFSTISNSYANLLSSASDMSGPGAIATIFNTMKVLDPGVAVMEGDVQLIRNSGGQAAKLAGLYESVLNGNPLPESVRRDLVRQATNIFNNRKKQYDALAEQYKVIAQSAGAEPTRVVVPRPSVGGGRTTPNASMPTGPDGNPTLDTTAGANTGIPPLRLKKGQKAVDAIPEGEKRLVNMGGGKTRVIQKVGGKIVVVEE